MPSLPSATWKTPCQGSSIEGPVLLPSGVTIHMCAGSSACDPTENTASDRSGIMMIEVASATFFGGGVDHFGSPVTTSMKTRWPQANALALSSHQVETTR